MKKLMPSSFITKIARIQTYLEHFRNLNLGDFKPLFRPLLKIIYSDDKEDERDKGSRCCRLISDHNLLNINNQLLKQSQNSILSDCQIQFLEIFARSSQTASRRRSTESAATADHSFIVHQNHRMLGSEYVKEKKFNMGHYKFKAYENLLLHKNWIAHNLILM